MRRTWSAVLLLALGACASGGREPAVSALPEAAAPAALRTALPADVLPFTAATTHFATRAGTRLVVRTEPDADALHMYVSDGSAEPRRLDWRRSGASVFVSKGPESEVEILRIGALPGAAWEAGPYRVAFEGWERVETPAGSYDAARIAVALGPSGVQQTLERWWFAPGTGLVRLSQDNGGLFSMEMWRTP